MRALRLLLALLVLPVTLIAVTAAAGHAAGATGSFSLSTSAGKAGALDADLDCVGSVTMSDGSAETTVAGSLECAIDAAYSSDPGPGELDRNSTEVTMSGSVPSTGDFCESFADSDGDPMGSLTLAYSATALGCVFTQVCVVWDWTDDKSFSFDESYSGEWCGDISMAESKGSCAHGMPLQATIHGIEFQAGDWRWVLRVTFQERPVQPFRLQLHGGVAYNTWWHHRTDMTAGGGRISAGWDGNTWETVFQNATQGFSGDVSFVEDGRATKFAFHGLSVEGPPIDGGIGAESFDGFTRPNDCLFWFGIKIKDDPNSTEDDPWSSAGSTGGVVPVEPPTLPDTEDSPTTDLGWLAAIVRVLEGIWTAVSGIAAAILNGLADLFVPSDGFMESQTQQAKDAWNGTAPMVWADSLTDVGDAISIASPGGGCSGPEWSFREPVGGKQVTLYPFSSCKPEIGQIASIVRAALTVSIYIGGFLVGLRLLAGAIGLELDLGRGGDRDR